MEGVHFQKKTKDKCSALRQTISSCSQNPKMGEKSSSEKEIRIPKLAFVVD